MKKNKKLVPAIVVFSVINGSRNYISGTCQHFTGKKIAFYSEDINKAVPFITALETENFIAELYNPRQRRFEKEHTVVPEKDILPVF